MRLTLVLAALAASAAALIPAAASAQQPGITRTDLSRNALSTGGRDSVQVLVEFGPGVTAGRHSHAGEELVFVTEGVLEYALDGSPPVTLRRGDVLFIPNGTVHAVRNLHSGRSAELATYVVDPARPLVTPAPPHHHQKDSSR